MMRTWQFALSFAVGSLLTTSALASDVKRTVISLGIPGPAGTEDSTGGIIVADLTGDAKPDYLVTCTGHLAAYDNVGSKLWIKKTNIVVGGQSESQGLPGHHGPGVAAGDVDGDRRTEVVFLTKDGVLHIVDGAKGYEIATARPPVPDGAQCWEVAMIVDFRGTGGDRDLLLQATNKSGYRMGRYLAAYSYENLIKGKQPLWTTDKFVSCAHNAARLADLDGDGRDEVLGATIFSPDGKLLAQAQPFRGHMDSVFVADGRPDVSGLEVILLEEGSNYVQVLGVKGPIWREHFNRQEPQNAAIGEFDLNRPGLEVWCRSRYNAHQKPFVFDAQGQLIANYEMDSVAPEDWTIKGVEVIFTIDWTGGPRQLAAAKERHKSGDVSIFDPISGKFLHRFKEKADRLYVADVSGDWREELIVLNGNELHIYQNDKPNPNPDRPRLWDQNHYRRAKMTWNYYSP